MKLSTLLIGLLAIAYGAINLGLHMSIRVFYWGLVVFGVVFILERLPAVIGHFQRQSE